LSGSGGDGRIERDAASAVEMEAARSRWRQRGRDGGRRWL